jgi:oxygen-dependent protoporphyrinogen oxidase
MSTSATTDTGPIFVIGAGPSGLTAAHRLLREGQRPIVIEARDRVGGQVHTHREQGYLMEEGATILPSAYQAVLDVVEEVGMTKQLIPAGSVIGFCRDDKVHEMRSDHLFLDAARTKIVSGLSKLAMARVGIDNFRCHKLLNYEDLSSMAEFDTMSPKEYCAKHLGLSGEVYDYVIDSTVRGVLGVRSEKISVAELFFMLNNILGTRLFAFRNGYSEYIEALASPLDVRLSCHAQEIVETADGVKVTWVDADGKTHVQEGAGAIVTTRGDLLPDMLPGYFDQSGVDFLKRLVYTKVVVMNTGVTKKPAGISASVVQVPEDIDAGLMAFTCEHNKAPGRAPEGHGLIGFLSMTEWAQRLITEDDETVQREYLMAAEKIMPGISDTVDYVRITRWNECIVYSRPGLYRELGEFMCTRPQNTRIQLGGIFFSSSNICTATTAGERAVRELLPVVRADGHVRRNRSATAPTSDATVAAAS